MAGKPLGSALWKRPARAEAMAASGEPAGAVMHWLSILLVIWSPTESVPWSSPVRALLSKTAVEGVKAEVELWCCCWLRSWCSDNHADEEREDECLDLHLDWC